MASATFEAEHGGKAPNRAGRRSIHRKAVARSLPELMQTGAVIAIQDMGAAGLTWSAVEMGAKGNLGVALDLDGVPCREAGMTAYEMLLSESQERMLMVLDQPRSTRRKRFFANGASISRSSARPPAPAFTVTHQGMHKADLPIKELGDRLPFTIARILPRRARRRLIRPISPRRSPMPRRCCAS